MVIRNRLGAVAAGLSFAGMGIAASAQAAELIPGPNPVTDTASTTTPVVPGGQCYPGVPDPSACRRILDLLHVSTTGGNWIYAAGIVDAVKDTTTGVTTTGYHNIFRYNALTHKLDTKWKPQFSTTATTYTDAPVTGLAASADGGTLYVAGAFTQTATAPGGVQTPRKGVAAISTVDGSVKPFNTRVCSSGGGCVVNDVQLVNGTLWLGGSFANVGGTATKALVFVDPVTGARRPGQLPVSGVITITAGTKVAKLAINNQRTQAVVIGNFASVGNATHKEVAVLDITATGGASVNSWNAPKHLDASVTDCSQKDTWARGVDWNPAGTYFDLAASGGGGFDAYPALCDSFSRFKSDGNPNATAAIVNATGFDSEFTVCDTGSYAYLGGHFKSQNHIVRINGNQKVLSGRTNEHHYGMAAISVDSVDPNYGFAAKTWNDSIITGRGAGWASCLGLSGTGSQGGGVYIGGDAESVNGNASIQRLAYFPSSG